eukprot:scaffold66018_cov26-Tisochrysis_lutea.AAC.1
MQRLGSVGGRGGACLVHTRLVEPHDGGVGEPVKDLAGSLHTVNLLATEELCDELGIIHCTYHILQNCGVDGEVDDVNSDERAASAIASLLVESQGVGLKERGGKGRGGGGKRERAREPAKERERARTPHTMEADERCEG